MPSIIGAGLLIVLGLALYLVYRYVRGETGRLAPVIVSLAAFVGGIIIVESVSQIRNRSFARYERASPSIERIPNPPLPSPRLPFPSRVLRDSVSSSRGDFGFSSVDDILNSLNWGATAFNVPPAVNLDSTADIHLVLTPSDTATREYLVKLVQPTGVREFVEVRVSPRMLARLTSAYFEIISHSPEEQAVSANIPTEWKWTIKPQRKGKWPLILTLDAFVDVAGRESPRTVQSMEKTIQVNVTRSQVIFGFLNKHWEFLLGSILLPTSVWLISRRLRIFRQVVQNRM